MPEYQMEREYELEIGGVDERRMARPSTIVGIMQDLATCHAEELGLDKAAWETSRAFWVLSRMKYHVNRPLMQHETIRAVTWPRMIRGALWYRDFRFFVGKEEVGYAVTGWAIIDVDRHRLVRPKALGLNVPDQIDGIQEQLSQIPCHDLKPLFERTVRYSDIDVNRHLNNVKAIDILTDAIGLEEHPDWYVSEMTVNYKAETACGTLLTLLRKQEGGGITLQAVAGDEEKLQAYVAIESQR